jgi:hypothetical protein
MTEGTLTTENFKEGVKDLLLGMLSDIQGTLLEETVINPMKDFLTKQLGALFGFGGDKDKLSRYAQGDALRVVMAGGGANLPQVPMPGALKQLGIESSSMDPVKDIMAANQSMAGITSGQLGGPFESMDDTLVDVEGALGTMVDSSNLTAASFDSLDSGLQGTTGLFGQFGQGLSSAIGGLGSFISGLFGSFGGGGTPGSGILGFIGKIGSSIFGAASGGIVRHMAAGGMQRDRVPAMLEPGEFVMKRSSVNRIGAGNLASMNAGSSSGAPNIEVVVNNEGSPKDASASVKPQVDVNKMVVEIVTRDIRNNGPIRKSLRTGAE